MRNLFLFYILRMSIGSEVNPGFYGQSVRDVSHIPGGRLQLLSDSFVVTFLASEHRHVFASKLYWLVTAACERLTQGCSISRWDSYLRPLCRQSDALTTVLPKYQATDIAGAEGELMSLVIPRIAFHPSSIPNCWFYSDTDVWCICPLPLIHRILMYSSTYRMWCYTWFCVVV